MNWHERYLLQAAWTRDLRRYVFERCNWRETRRILEVGCGTGAVLVDPAASEADGRVRPIVYGLDRSAEALAQCCQHAPGSMLTHGDARTLPYASQQFDMTYCHYLLLWVQEPLYVIQEMKRVTVKGGYVLAFAEPDYDSRVDRPVELARIGLQQNAALERQGAALNRGGQLADLFQEAGLSIIETGMIEPASQSSIRSDEWENEWRMLEADVVGLVPLYELRRVRDLDREAWKRGEHVLRVPTYFAWGQV